MSFKRPAINPLDYTHDYIKNKGGYRLAAVYGSDSEEPKLTSRRLYYLDADDNEVELQSVDTSGPENIYYVEIENGVAIDSANGESFPIFPFIKLDSEEEQVSYALYQLDPVNKIIGTQLPGSFVSPAKYTSKLSITIDDVIGLKTELKSKVTYFDTLEQAINEADTLKIYEGASLFIREYSSGNGEGAMWKVAATLSVVPNGDSIVQSIALPSLSVVERYAFIEENIIRETVTAGRGSLNTSNTEVRFSTAFGFNALGGQTEGTSNTAIGCRAMENTNGESSANNVAVGRYAMQDNVSGFDNTAIGSSALEFNTEGKANTAIGRNSMLDCLSGKDNVAVGEGCMPRLKDASSNTAVGVNCLQYTDEDGSGTADTNSGLGAAAMRFNRLGKNNVALGHRAMEGYKQGKLAVFTTSIGSGQVTAVNVVNSGFGYTSTPSVKAAGGGGSGASFTAIMEDDGTGEGTLKVSSVTVDSGGSGYTSEPTAATNGGGIGDAGRLDDGDYDSNNNTAVGQLALGGLLDGDENVAVGRNAGGGIKDGLSNVAIGNDSLAFAECTNVIAIGRNALGNTTSATTSTVIGTNSAKTTESDLSGVTSVGYEALRDIATDNNVGVGAFAGRLATDGSGLTSVGAGAMSSGVITGNNNTAVGSVCMDNVTSGFNNTAIGRDALSSLQNADPLDSQFNCSGIGFQASVSGSNQIQLGNTSTTTYAYGAVQDRSDFRDKEDIQNLTDNHVDFILSVDWKLFKWDMRDDYKIYDEDGRVTGLKEKDGSKKRNRLHAGVIAQEVAQKAKENNIDFAGYQDHSIGGGCDVKSIGYSEFIPYLGELCKRQQKTIDQLIARIEELESKI